MSTSLDEPPLETRDAIYDIIKRNGDFTLDLRSTTAWANDVQKFKLRKIQISHPRLSGPNQGHRVLVHSFRPSFTVEALIVTRANTHLKRKELLH